MIHFWYVPHISRNQLDPLELQKLFMQMNKLVIKLGRNTVDSFFSELLGPEERIMVAKRLAIVIMLVEKNSLYLIADTLGVSTSTVAKVLNDVESGRYDKTVHLLRKNKRDYEKLWNTLDIILRAGMPSQGRDRWKSIFKE